MPQQTEPAALAAKLRDLYVGRRTGRLVFSGDPQRTALLWKGRVVYASSSAEDEHLGGLLAARGRLSEEDLARATQKVVAENKRLGEVLIEMELLDRDGLEEAVAEHVREIFVRALSQPQVHVEFEELDPERPMEEDVSSKIATGDLILEAVNRVPIEDLDHALGDPDRRLVLSNDPLLRFQRISLGPVDGYVLSRVDGSVSATELLQMIPMVPEEAKLSLLRLLSAGIIEFDAAEATPRASKAAPPEPVRAPPPAASPSVVTAPAPAVAPPPPPPVPESPPAAAPRPPRRDESGSGATAPPPSNGPPVTAPAQAPRGKGIGAQRREISEAFEALTGKTHFEILQLTHKAQDADVKKAYFALARDFHPDRFADPRLADLRPQAEAIFMRIGEAYDVLRDAKRRGDYESDLKSRAPWTPPLAPEPAAADEPPLSEAPAGDGNPALLAQQAEEAVRKARLLFKQEQYWDVIQLLEPHAEAAVGIWKVHARLLLAKCYLQNPNWLRRGEEELLAVIELDPKHAQAHVLLGKFYGERGLKARAATLLHRAVELDPENEEARNAAARFKPEEPAQEPAPKKGLFKKLFGGEKG